MKIPKSLEKVTDFNTHLESWMKDPKFREGFLREKMKLEVSVLVMNLRKKKKVSQKQLADRLGTSQSAIARLEAGKSNVTIDTLVRIANRLNAKLTVNIG